MEKDEIHQSLVQWAVAECHAERVEVEWLGIDPARLPAGGVPRWAGDPCRDHPTLELTWNTRSDLDLYTVRPELSVWVTAPVATAPAAAGTHVTTAPGLVRLGATGGIWTDGTPIALRPIRVGEAVTPWNARRAPDAEAGALVTLRIRVGNLEVRAEGALMNAANIGERVRAMNHATHSIVRGTLVTVDLLEL